MYPHKDEVKSKRLIRQWISEGFLKSEEGTLVEEEETVEDVAAEYLDVLIKKKLVQVSSFTIDGKPKSCHDHYLIHDMILRQFKDFGFCRRISEDVQSHTREIARRLSIATNCSEDLPGFFDDLTRSVESKFIQSVLLFTKEVVLTAEFVESIPKTYPLLQVLDFENAQLSWVQDLGDLTYLKYLSFRNTQIQSLPKSIGKLHNLETLDLRQTAVKEIPKEVCKLTKLRHLLGKDMSLVQLKDGIGGMKSLQTLRHVKLDGSGTELITELGKL
ncbi:disease resistance protein PIK6-NP-like isoform X1 [Lotus japonicus]|uniref:disease resistance protein PIK6-NP-like isoform X1 n=1 Tax=Lotus japonicus TaxID=34305 RepID=UPI002582B1F4|nr:disease resistance protein PIK6-NP-like isoform X1 [Lotus japonicus]